MNGTPPHETIERIKRLEATVEFLLNYLKRGFKGDSIELELHRQYLRGDLEQRE